MVGGSPSPLMKPSTWELLRKRADADHPKLVAHTLAIVDGPLVELPVVGAEEGPGNVGGGVRRRRVTCLLAPPPDATDTLVYVSQAKMRLKRRAEVQPLHSCTTPMMEGLTLEVLVMKDGAERYVPFPLPRVLGSGEGNKVVLQQDDQHCAVALRGYQPRFRLRWVEMCSTACPACLAGEAYYDVPVVTLKGGIHDHVPAHLHLKVMDSLASTAPQDSSSTHLPVALLYNSGSMMGSRRGDALPPTYNFSIH